MGIYRFWRDSGFVVGGLIAGVVADLAGNGMAIGLVAALTAGSGLVVARTRWDRRLGPFASQRAAAARGRFTRMTGGLEPEPSRESRRQEGEPARFRPSKLRCRRATVSRLAHANRPKLRSNKGWRISTVPVETRLQEQALFVDLGGRNIE